MDRSGSSISQKQYVENFPRIALVRFYGGRTMRTFLLSLAAFAFLAACGGINSNLPSTSISLYKYAGSVQCTGGGMSLSEMERQLTDADIQVLSSACGLDGNVYASVCGSADGRIGIFEVPEAKAQAASSLGFAPLSDLPAATKVACQ